MDVRTRCRCAAASRRRSDFGLALYKFRNLWHSSKQEEGPCTSTMSVSGIRGFYRLAYFGHRWEMTPNNAHHRLKILHFFARHGLTATCEAFGVSRRTLYRWKRALTQAAGDPQALAAHSSAPHRRLCRRHRLQPAHHPRPRRAVCPAPRPTPVPPLR